ncbi:RNA polymerase sigma factor [Sinomonas susongensis]|uniref:RNA polymerase sigma factor n=1 Tax=Sinomonas susongensis TaxID=1324851 RepID=UPI001FEA71D7|nr:RNA polymerase sigma factor [Sinomonas susongensis]
MEPHEDPNPEIPTMDPGDHAELFTTAFRTLSPSVHGYLRARGVDDCEAVTQDVFLSLYSRIGSLRGGLDGAKALVFTIAHSRAVDHHRRRQRTPALVPHEPELDPRATPATTEDLALGTTGALNLLNSLTDDHREVLLLRVVADLSIDQTADIMGRSTGAIKQLQRRALEALRSHAATRELSAS